MVLVTGRMDQKKQLGVRVEQRKMFLTHGSQVARREKRRTGEGNIPV